MSLSRKRLNHAILASCTPAHRRSVAIMVAGGLPPTHAPNAPHETQLVHKGVTYVIRGNLTEPPRESPSQKEGQGAA